MKDERPNGIVHNSVKEGAACEIPPLTKGLQLIDQIVDQTIKVCHQPHGYGNKERQAYVRKSLEKYMTELEKETGNYTEHVKNSGGRPSSKGWSVSKSRHGNWRIQLCSLSDGRPHQVRGVHKTKEIAERVARALMVKLRENAA